MASYNMSYETAKRTNRKLGCINHHLSPMSIKEMNETLSYYRKNGYDILNLKIWRV